MAAQVILISDWLISKKSSPLKPLSQMDQHLVGSILGKTFIKIPYLVPIVYKHGRHNQFLHLIGRFLKNLFSEAAWPNEVVNRNLVGSIIGRSSIKIAHLVLIC
jgi:hypothetical protein